MTNREYIYEQLIFNAIDRLGIHSIGNLVEHLSYKECLDIFVKMYGWKSQEVKQLQNHFNVLEKE